MYKKQKLLLISLLALGTMSIASCAGAKGDKGDTGPKGDAGQNGQDGKDGQNGKDGEDGTIWLTGETVPSESEGKLGDFYLNTLTGDLYVKTSEGWVLKINIKGEDGKDGTNGTSGSNGVDGKTAYSNTILPSEGGYVTVNKGSALVNEEITFSFVPDTGYALDTVYINNEEVSPTLNDKGIYEYETTMVENGFVVKANFILDSEVSYVTGYFKDGKIYENAKIDKYGNVIEEGTLVSGASFVSGEGSKEDPLVVNSEDQLYLFSTIDFDTQAYVKLEEKEDKSNYELSQTLVFKESMDYTFDLNGQTLTPKGDLKNPQRGAMNYLFEVYGDFTLDDSTATESNPRGEAKLLGGRGCIDVEPSGNLTVNAGLLTDISRSGGSAIYGAEGATITINYAEIYCSNFAIGAALASVTINDGTFISVANNSMTDESGNSAYTYCINVGNGSVLNKGKIVGIQGGIATINGDVTINEGIDSRTSAKEATELYSAILEETYQDLQFTDEEYAKFTEDKCFYGLYIAGETVNGPVTTVNGGYFSSSYRSASYIGNSNDGGDGSTANAIINGGTFDSLDNKMSTIYVDQSNPDYGYGNAIIKGGMFLENGHQNTKSYIEARLENGYTLEEVTVDGNTYYNVVKVSE